MIRNRYQIRGRHFVELSQVQQDKGKSLCVGLDSDMHQIPERFLTDPRGIQDIPRAIQIAKDNPHIPQLAFNEAIVWETCKTAGFYMADDSFYKACGADGILTLKKTIEMVRNIVPEAPFILGGCAGGVDHSNRALIEYAFDYLGADAITIYPYFGQDALQCLLDLNSKGIIVLSRTSNQGANEFQDVAAKEDDEPMYRTVAYRVSSYWNNYKNCGLLIGPMSHGELGKIRSIVDDIPIFVTGIGTQGKTGRIEDDDVQEIVVNGKNSKGSGIIVCSSRAIIFSPDPQQEALRLHHLINRFRKESPQMRELSLVAQG